MIEILVALVILAIGLLGMATLMINSLQTSQSAAMRSTATLAAYDLIERMRSNADEEVLEAGSYAILLPKAASDIATGASSTPCTNSAPKVLASCELKMWAKALSDSLPDAQVVVKKLDLTGTAKNHLWCIGIAWNDSGGNDVIKSTDKPCDALPSFPFPFSAYYETKVLL